MSDRRFDRGDIFIKGDRVGEALDGSVEISNNARDVITLYSGYAGHSKGPLMGSIQFSRAVPVEKVGGGWTDVDSFIIDTRPLTISVTTGGTTYAVTGVLKKRSISFGESKTAVDGLAIDGSITTTDATSSDL